MSGLARRLNLPSLLTRKSFFLLGPRATGKTFLIRQQLKHSAFVIDLLRSELYLRLAANPSELEPIVTAAMRGKPIQSVVIDEIQKIPSLLDEVHRLIEEKGWRFLLTGSSARKLRNGQANLLAGRAWTAELFPLCWQEIKSFDLHRYLRYGGLPSVYLGQEPDEELNAYVRNYLYEEIQAEGLVRKIPQFSRFLHCAALSSGQLINFAQISSDTGVAASTIREHYRILEDTLIGFSLPAWTGSKKRKAIATTKFYLFDTGVTHALAQTKALDRNSDLYGRSFEHFILMEIRAFVSYHRRRDDLCFWQSTHQHEVDIICGDHTAIEVKATKKVTPRDLRGLTALAEEKHFANYYLVSQDPIPMRRGVINCVPWKQFLEKMWGGDWP